MESKKLDAENVGTGHRKPVNAECEQVKNQPEAQARIEQIQAFQRELICLQKQTPFQLSNEQSQVITDYHHATTSQLRDEFNVDLSSDSKRLTWGMKIASLVGALALFASVFFMFYQFWGEFSEVVQVGVLVVAPLLTLVAAMHLARKEGDGFFAKIAAMISFGCFVLNLSMLGQIFNITPSPNAALVWSAYALALGYLCNARLLIFVAGVCLLNYLAMTFGSWFGIYWISFGERPENFFIPALLLFIAPLIVSRPQYTEFDPIYRILGMLAFFLPVLILSSYGSISYLPLDKKSIELFYEVFGLVLASAVIYLGVRFEWKDTVNTGLTFLIVFLYTKFFDWWWDYLPKWLFFLVIGVISIGLLVSFKKVRSQLVLKEQKR